jgi:hypothetical protein
MRKHQVTHGSSRGARRLKQPLRLPLNRARKNTALAHPLTIFLEAGDADDSRLSRLARQLSRQPVDLNHFREELLNKLKRVPYSQPRDLDRHKPTFFDRLKVKGALSVVLRTSTLHGIRKWLLLREIISTDRDLERKNLSVDRYSLRFHQVLTSELSRHEKAIIRAISNYKADRRWLDEYLSAVDGEKMRQLRILCLSRWPGSRKALLKKHQKEDVVVEIGIFELLKQLFANVLPDRFLRRLTQLVCAPPDVNEISNERDEALRLALTRRQ